MEADQEWGAKVRTAVRVAIDRVAWDSIHVRRPCARAEIARLTAERDAAAAGIAAQAAALSAERQAHADLTAAMSEVDGGRTALQRASETAARLEAELASALQSKSWRWTAGLRRLRRLASRPAAARRRE